MVRHPLPDHLDRQKLKPFSKDKLIDMLLEQNKEMESLTEKQNNYQKVVMTMRQKSLKEQ